MFQVIQRRFNGKINFNRTWKDYEYGFGTINGEHWLGRLTLVGKFTVSNTNWVYTNDML